jgi:hypothetical protein
MTFSRRAALVIVWALSLIGVGAWARAEGQQQQPPVITLGPEVVSGENLGFRVHRVQGDTRIGRLVVRVDGKWVEVQFALGVSPAGK